MPSKPSSTFHRFAQGHRASFYPIVPEVRRGRIVPMDLTAGGTLFGDERPFENLPRFIEVVRTHLEHHEADYGIGGYAEQRPVYITPAFRAEGPDGLRWRSMHLGLDIWTHQAGTPVYAPLAGSVHSFAYDPEPGCYGNTIILQHDPASDLRFYTLYGHLSEASLVGLRAGSRVAAGQCVGTLGAPEENGGWPPHLHFQVILDLLDYEGDFPGVAFPDEAEEWLSRCPDPQLLTPGLAH